MRTLTNKRGIIAAAAVLLLLTAMLVTGCSDSAAVEKPYTPPAGMGAVILNFNKNIARATILPNEADIDSFAEFILTFTADSLGTGVTQTITRANTDALTRNAPINLLAGVYDLQVVAHLTASDPTSAAAVFSDSSINISTGQTTSLNITLKPYDPADATEDGTFAWNITNSITGTISVGSKMSLTKLDNSTVTGWKDVDLDTPANTSNFSDTTGIPIPSGYYYLDITLIVNSQTRIFRHVVHIYQNLKSTFAFEFTNAYVAVRIIFTPTITYSNPDDDPPVLAVVKAGGGGTLGASDGSLASPYILSITGTTYPSSITVTVSNFSTAFSGGSIIGSFKGISVAPTPTSDVFTLSTSASPFNVAGGPYQFAVTGIKADDSAYISVIFISIEADGP